MKKGSQKAQDNYSMGIKKYYFPSSVSNGTLAFISSVWVACSVTSVASGIFAFSS